MSLLKLEDAKILPRLLETFADAIRREISPNEQFSSDRLDYVRDVFIAAAAGDVRPLIDFRDLCRGFRNAECQALKALSHDAGTSTLESLIVHQRAHPDLEDLRGIGIFVPFVTDDYDLERLGLQDAATDEDNASDENVDAQKKERKKTGKEVYGDLSLFQASRAEWPKLVYDELRREIPSEVMTCLTSVGATRREDRWDIAQIVLSIEASFNKLDRVLDNARTCVAKKLDSAEQEASRVLPRPGESKPDTRFGPPWLSLIQRPNLATRVTTLRQLAALRELEFGGTPAPAGYRRGTTGHSGSEESGAPLDVGNPVEGTEADLVDVVVEFFDKVERAVGEVERATRKGMTNAKFGLGPTAPGQFNVGEPMRLGGSEERPKSGTLGDSGEGPKSGALGDAGEGPKSGALGALPASASMVLGGDLRVDLAFARVVELFCQVGQALQRLEQATRDLEVTARDMLAEARIQNLSRKDFLRAVSGEIKRGFRILQEASTNARRTVRRVLSHPVYGVGPTSGAVDLEARQALADAGGLDRRNLRLL